MEFEKAIRAAGEVLYFAERFLDVSAPQGLWFCNTMDEVNAIQTNAVCFGTGADWEDVVRCREFIRCFEYLVIVTPNAIARERMVQELRPRLPDVCIYQVTDFGFRNCKTVQEFIDAYGWDKLPDVLAGAEELPSFGLLNLADVPRRDMSKVPRTLSRFSRLDSALGGFFAGELSVWTGKRGAGKSTLLSQILLEAVDQGHTVCAYSGELPAEQFREWTYLQAAGPEHIVYVSDPLTGKKLAAADPSADKQISEWLNERFLLFDLEKNTRHSPEAILSQFEYAKRRYGADVFLVDNIMSVDFDGKDRDFYRVQSEFTRMLVTFSKRNRVHTHLVVHPRKSSGDSPGKVSADDVAGSGDITNRADNVFFLATHAVEEAGKKAGVKPILQVIKNRDFGSRGSQWLDFDKKSRRFFADRIGDPKRAYGWDPMAQQVVLQVDPDAELDEIFPEEGEDP